MTEDDLLNRLLEEVGRDMTPVRPVRPLWIRALVPVAACLAIGALVIFLAGLRPDVEAVGPWRLLGFTLAQVALCAGLFALSLRWSIPAMGGLPSTAAVSAMGALGVQALITWAILERSALVPPSGLELKTGLACLGAIVFMSVPSIAAGAVLMARGLVTRWLAAFVVIGFASGLAAEAFWRTHCQYSTWIHVLPFHWGPIGLAAAVAVAAAIYVRRTAEPVLRWPWQ